MEPLPYLSALKQIVIVMFSVSFTAIIIWAFSKDAAESESHRMLPLEENHG